jgi:hypothetical protein
LSIRPSADYHEMGDKRLPRPQWGFRPLLFARPNWD